MREIRARLHRKGIARVGVVAIVALVASMAGCMWLRGTSSQAADGGGAISGEGPPGGGVITQPPPHVDFVTAPPGAVAVSIQRKSMSAPPTKSLLFVKYDADPRLSASVTLYLDDGRVVVRDDGQAPDELAHDLVYTGEHKLDFAALQARQAHFDALAQQQGQLFTPDFRGRSKVGRKPLPRLDVEQYLGGARVLFPLDWALPQMVDYRKSLLVTDPNVIADPTRTYPGCSNPPSGVAGNPNGSWTVGRLMTLLAGGATQAPAFIDHWLAHWRTAITVDGVAVPIRAKPNALTDVWGTPVDPAKAPLRLLAIVNRFDLAGNLAYGGGSGGEVRLVYGLVAGDCSPLKFTLIFEYGIHVDGCKAFRDWVQRWKDLGLYDLSDPNDLASYSSDLAALVEEVVAPGGIDGHLNQIRTNEIDFVDMTRPVAHEWEMREFKLDTAGQLSQTVLARTPDEPMNHTTTLWDFITTSKSAIQQQVHTVPDAYPTPTSHFLGRYVQYFESRLPTTRGNWWGGPSPANSDLIDARHKFSLNTCDGCHAGETLTQAVHINPQTAALSAFLTGTGTVDDPEGAVITPPRSFSDLERRQRELDAITDGSCIPMIHLNTERLLVKMSG